MAVVDPTTNFEWDLPNNEGDSGNWGNMLREILGDNVTGIDAVLGAVEATADAAMPKAGGVFTGEIDILTARYELVNLGSLSGTESVDLTAGNFFYGTVTGTTTFEFDDPSSDGVFFILELTNGGAQTVNWPNTVRWPNGTQPQLTESGVDILTFFTRDAGTTWRGAMAMEDSS
jgi:hypothetical protein